MTLLERLQDDMKAALKGGHKDRLGVLRMLINEVKNIDLMPNRPTAEEAVAAYGKKLRKSIEEYEKLGRADESARLMSELAVVEEYLPRKASPEETEKMVDDFLATNTFTEKEAGRAMGMFMKLHGGNVDAAVVNPLLRKKLAGK